MASQRTAPGLITEQLMHDFNVTATTIGLLTSMQFLVYTSLQIPMGILADRFGPNTILITGATLTGIGTIIYSLGTHEYILIVGRVLTGLGDATVWVSMVLILSRWFYKREFVRLIGIAGMTGSLGFLVATVPFSLWILFLGWRAAFFTTGLFLCLCSVLLYFILIKQKNRIFPDELEVTTEENPREKTVVLLTRIISSKQAWALFFCHFGVVGGYVGFIGSWAVPYGMNMYEMSSSDASRFIMIGLVGALIGAPITSWISSKLETVKRPYIVVHVIVLCGWTTFLLCNGAPTFILLTIIFFVIGYGYGASALTFAAVRQSFPVKDSGIVSGFVNTGGFLSAVLLPFIFGYILDYFQATWGNSNEGYYFSFITPVVFSIVGLIGIILFKEERVKI